MSELGIIILIYVVGVVLLLAEIFIPSHGILCVTSMGFLVTAVAKTFSYGGRDAGVLAILALAVFLPVFGYVSIKYWHQTPIGRRISPPNPTLTSADVAVPVDELNALIGMQGKTVTALRPVGTGEFEGRRVTCVAEMGVIDEGEQVVATGIKNGNLAVTRHTA